MANLPEQPEWEPGIYQLETSDPVLAGPDGIDNLQAKQLGNRTAYLKGQVDAIQQEMADQHPLLRKDVAAAAGPLAWLGDLMGSANTLTLTLKDPAAVLTAYAAGQRFQFKATANNTGIVTVDICGLGAKLAKKIGATGLESLEADDIRAGVVYELTYDGTYFQLNYAADAYARKQIKAHADAADPHPQYLLRSAVVKEAGPMVWLGAAAGTANALTLTLKHAVSSLSAYSEGQHFQFKATIANTGPVTAKIGALAAVAIKKATAFGLVDLVAGDIKPGALYDLNYDGMYFQLGGGVGDSSLPVGSLLPFPKGEVPPGFLEVDGSTQSATVYPELAAYLGTTYNKGDEPAGYFRLPDYRGEFLRGWDHDRGVDAGRTLGSLQLDALQKVTGKFGRVASTAAPEGDVSGPFSLGETLNQIAAGTSANLRYLDFDLSRSARTAAETRPRNLAVMWCIKAWNAPVNQGNIDISALADDVYKARRLAVQGAFHDLLITTTGLSSLVKVKASDLVVKDGAGNAALMDALAVTINLATVGANGLDAGAAAASSWYSVWAIQNGATKAAIAVLCPTLTGSTTLDSAVVTGLASTASMRVGMPFSSGAFPGDTVVASIDSSSQITASAPALSTTASASLRFIYEPVMPAGYTMKARIGAFLTDPSGVPLAYTQNGATARLEVTAGSNTLNYLTAASGVASTAVSVSLVNLVPPAARKAALVAGTTGGYVGFAPEGGFTATPGSGYLSPAQPNGFPFASGYNASGPVPTTVGEVLLRRLSVRYCATASTGIMQLMGWEDTL